MISKVKGTIDLIGEEAKKWKYVDSVIDTLMDKYNYNYIRTPIFEHQELFYRGVGDSTDIVNKETYDFIDRGKRKLTLRPEGTAGVVRSVIEHKLYAKEEPLRFYYNGTMYRYERPQAGREREFTQFGVEVFSLDNPAVDAEVISVGVNLLKLLGLQGVKVRINSLGDQESRDTYKKVLEDYFKEHLKDLCEDCNNRFEKNVLRILDCKIDGEKEIVKNAPKMIDYLNESSKQYFNAVLKYLDEMDIEYEIDSSIIRGLDYYTHTIFEVEALVEGFGSNNILLGGGRYSNLVQELGGPELSGVGLALGIGRLIRALELEEVELPIESDNEIYILNVSKTEREYAITLGQYLRMSGYKVSVNYEDKSLKAQFKAADRERSKYLIILNDQDLVNDEVSIKNNRTKTEEKVEIDYLLYYFDEQFALEGEEDEEIHEHAV